MSLSNELDTIAEIAARHAAADEQVAAILAAEPHAGERVFLCAFDGVYGRTWLALSADGAPISARDRVRDAVSIAALCELAEEIAGVAIGTTRRLASPDYLDELGSGRSEVALAVRQGVGAVEELSREVEARYKVPLDES